MECSYVFLNERVPPVDMDNHALMRSMMLLDAIGITSNEIEYSLPVQDQDRTTLDALLARHGISESRLLVAINPVAKWETKLWDNVRFAKLADILIQQYRASVVFTGGSEDRGTVQDIISAMQGKATNLAGKTTLRTLAALYEKTDFLISTDTGPMHIAASVGTPVIALFGPTAPWRTGPFGPDHQVIRVDMECSPCFKRQCSTKRCMEEISVEQVLDGVQKLGL